MTRPIEHWMPSQILDLAQLKGDDIVRIFNECGQYTERFYVKNLSFRTFVVYDNHLRAIYEADVRGLNEDEWTYGCDIFIWKNDKGGWEADFGGAPNGPA